jgi:hypothetical protein
MTSGTREIIYAWMMGAILGSALTGVLILAVIQGASQCS